MLAEQKATFIIVSRLDNQVITSFVSHGLLFSSYKCFWGSLQVFCNQETNEWNEFVQKFEMLISYFVFFFVKQSKHQDSRKIGKKIEICFFVKWNFFQRFCHCRRWKIDVFEDLCVPVRRIEIPRSPILSPCGLIQARICVTKVFESSTYSYYILTVS